MVYNNFIISFINNISVFYNLQENRLIFNFLFHLFLNRYTKKCVLCRLASSLIANILPRYEPIKISNVVRERAKCGTPDGAFYPPNRSCFRLQNRCLGKRILYFKCHHFKYLFYFSCTIFFGLALYV